MPGQIPSQVPSNLSFTLVFLCIWEAKKAWWWLVNMLWDKDLLKEVFTAAFQQWTAAGDTPRSFTTSLQNTQCRKSQPMFINSQKYKWSLQQSSKVSEDDLDLGL